MKKLLIILVAINTYSQETNFLVDEDRNVTWQRIYDQEGDKTAISQKLETYLKSVSFTRGLTKEGDGFSGFSGHISVKPIKGGNNYGDITAFIMIEVKKDKYRVTLSDFTFNDLLDGVGVGGAFSTRKTTLDFEQKVLKNKKPAFRENFMIQNYLISHDIVFKELFVIKEIKSDVKKDDW